MRKIILVLRKAVLDGLSCVNRGVVVLEDAITTGEQSLYHGIDLIGQNVYISLAVMRPDRVIMGPAENHHMAAQTITEPQPCFTLGNKQSVL